MDILTYILSKKYVEDSLAGAGALVGKSAYDIACENGFVGTPTEWLNSLKGDSPTIGPKGTWVIGDFDTGVVASPDLAGYTTEDYVKEQIDNIVFPTPDLSIYATREELNEALLGIKIPDVSGFATKVELENAIKAIPIPDLTGYVKQEFINKAVLMQKYEVLPIEGMLVNYNGNEIRLNTQRVTPIKQNVGSTGNPNMYYATFRAYAPEGATGVIESDGTQTDVEPTTLSTDTYGRKYTTIWSAIASFNGTQWTKWGDSSTINKYLGFYYTFTWYKETEIIGVDKVRVILTNDTCHNDLVPDPIARRIDEKIGSINIPEVDLSNYATQTYVQELIEGLELPEGIPEMIALTTEEILNICK